MTLRRALLIVTGATLAYKAARRSGLVCLLRNAHDPIRQLFGGYRCAVCHMAASDLDGFGGDHFGTGYVSPVRKVYEPVTGTVTRTPYYEKSMRGGH